MNALFKAAVNKKSLYKVFNLVKTRFGQLTIIDDGRPCYYALIHNSISKRPVKLDGGGGLPRYYALIHSVVSKRPFKLVKTRFGLLMMMMMACHVTYALIHSVISKGPFKLVKNQVWAAYDDDDGMPCYYALNHSVISKGPFQVGENLVWAAYDDDDGMPLYSALIHSAISKRPFKLPRNAQGKGCTWSVHARMLKTNQFFYLRKWNSVHSCDVSVRTSNYPRVGSDMVTDIVASCVRDRPLTRPTDVILDLKDDYGLDINYHVACG
ncbi:hypothetical protein ACSBR1_033415 [Camellia fascicularis]